LKIIQPYLVELSSGNNYMSAYSRTTSVKTLYVPFFFPKRMKRLSAQKSSVKNLRKIYNVEYSRYLNMYYE